MAVNHRLYFINLCNHCVKTGADTKQNVDFMSFVTQLNLSCHHSNNRQQMICLHIPPKTHFLPFLHNAGSQNKAPHVSVSRNTCNANCPQIYLQARRDVRRVQTAQGGAFWKMFTESQESQLYSKWLLTYIHYSWSLFDVWACCKSSPSLTH